MSRNRRQRVRRNLGNRARKRLPALLAKHGKACYWCKKPIVILNSVSKNLIASIDHGTITYKTGECVCIASVDHVVGLVDGGTNDLSNLVPSCRYCNEERGRLREQKLFSEQYKGYAWIRVKKWQDDERKSLKDRFDILKAHHIEETTFLVNKVRELARIVDEIKNPTS